MNAALALKLALRKRAPTEGVARWLDELADLVGYAEGTVRNDYYGENDKADLDRIAAYAGAFRARGDDGFAREVLAAVGLTEGSAGQGVAIPIVGRVKS